LTAIDKATILQLLSASSTLQYPSLWASVPVLKDLIRRTVLPMIDRPSAASDFIRRILTVEFRLPRGESDNIKALVLERMFEALEAALYLPEIVQAAMEIADQVLQVYRTDVFPIRRTR
jgi:hypothetical protein